jgi:hypothetical protein
MDIEIADFTFAFTPEHDFPVQPIPTLLQSFQRTADAAAPAAPIEMQLVLRLPAEGPTFHPVFTCGEHWALFRDGDEHLYATVAREAGPPRWTARISADCRRITYHAEAALLREGPAPVIAHPVLYPLNKPLLIHILARRRGVLLHASGVNLDGRGVALAGRSGAGKSTLARLFADSGKHGLLSDERIAVREAPAGFRMYGTPWAGDAQIARNDGAPLRALFFLAHGDRHEAVALSPSDAFRRLAAVASIPWYDQPVVSAMLDWTDRLLHQVPAFELRFTPTADVIPFLERVFDSL